MLPRLTSKARIFAALGDKDRTFEILDQMAPMGPARMGRDILISPNYAFLRGDPRVAALRKKAGLSQKELARQLKTTQQQISRLESPGYEGHSLSMLRRVAKALHARVRVVLEADPPGKVGALAEDPAPYRVKRAGALKGNV